MSLPKYALCNSAQAQDIEANIKTKHPEWSDQEVEEELRVSQRNLGMYNKYNEKGKIRKPKVEKPNG